MEQVNGRGFGRSWSRSRGRVFTQTLSQQEVLWRAEVLARLDIMLSKMHDFSKKLDYTVSL